MYFPLVHWKKSPAIFSIPRLISACPVAELRPGSEKLFARGGDDPLRLGESLGGRGFERPLAHVFVQHLDADRSVVADGPDRVQEAGDVELAIARQQALVDDGILELHRQGERAVVDLDAQRNVPRESEHDVEWRGARALEVEVVDHDAAVLRAGAAADGDDSIE